MADDPVITRLEAEIEAAGTQRAWADAHGFSAQFITDILKGRRQISPRLARALGFKRLTVWKDTRHTDQPNSVQTP